MVKKLVSTWKDSAKSRVRTIAESGRIRRQPLQRYQSSVRKLYDGPRGAVLKYSSLLSLHEPLMGQLFRSRRFDAARFETILDVGSGAGQIIRHLLQTTPNSTRIVGFDLSAEMLRRASVRLKSHRPNYVAADMMQMPFQDGSFDCITCGYVLEHLPDPVPGLKEFARVLKPGGSVLLLATENSFSGMLTSRTWNCRTYSRKELKDACVKSGLQWQQELWFTKVHEALKLGGILVELTKQPQSTEQTDQPAAVS